MNIVFDFLSVSTCIIFIVAFLICSSLFSFIKVVFLSRQTEREPTEQEKKIIEMVNKPGFSESISIGRILCNTGVAIFGLLLMFRLLLQYQPQLFHQYFLLWILLYSALVSFCVYCFTVFIPNLFGRLKPRLLLIFLSPAYALLRLPVIWVAKPLSLIYSKLLKMCGFDPKLSFLSEEQREAIRGDMSSAEEDSVLEEEEKQMILNIFDFVETPVREIMTPRVDMCAIDANSSLEKTIAILNNERHSRLPVYKDSIDNIVGILSNRDFLEWFTGRQENEPFDLEKLVMPAIFVPYHKKIDELLTELRRSCNQIAIVVDEYGGTAGLVTVEDILEEIVGEIRDEDDGDEDEDVQKLKDGRYILDPLMTLSDLEYELNVTLSAPEHSHVETLSGLIQATLGTIPSAGAEVEIDGYKFRVLKVDGTRMTKVMMIAPQKKESE